MLLLVVGAVALSVYLLHGFDGILQRDLAIYSYGGIQVVEGVPPYVSILNRAGPLAHLVPALGVAGARLGGFDDLLGIRVLFMLLSVACVCVVYAWARDTFSARAAGLVAAGSFLTFYGFIHYATYGPREKTIMVLFLTLSLWTATNKRWLVSGVTLSLSALVWQPVLLIGLAALLVLVIAAPGPERLRALVRLTLGGLIPVAACVIYFVAVGALQEFIDAYLLINARYTTSEPLLSDFATTWTKSEEALGASLWIFLAGMAALPVLSVLAIVRREWNERPQITILACFAASLVGIAWSFRDFNSWPDAMMLVPLAAIGIAGVWSEMTRHLSPKFLLAVSLVWVIVAVVIAGTYSVTRRDNRLIRQRASVRALLAQLPADPSILSIGGTEATVLTGATNPTRHQTFKRGLDEYVNDTYPGGLAGFARWISRTRPEVVVVNRGPLPQWVQPTIKSEYRRAGRAPGWAWYVHRSLDPDIHVDPIRPD